MQVSIFSDLRDFGPTEDGRQYTAEVFGVMVENQAGERWAHRVIFDGCRREVNEEGDGVYFADLRPEAKAQAEKLAARVAERLTAGGSLDWSQWFATDPAYGSAAYQALDSTGHFYQMEKARENF